MWPIAQVAELHHARYLLQPRALELFLYNHSSALLSFETPKVSHGLPHYDHSNVFVTLSAVLAKLLGVIDMLLMMRAYFQLPASTFSVHCHAVLILIRLISWLSITQIRDVD